MGTSLALFIGCTLIQDSSLLASRRSTLRTPQHRQEGLLFALR